MEISKIGIDLDDVVYDFVPAYLRFYNSQNNTNFKVEDVYSLRFSVVFDISEEEIIRSIYDFQETDAFDNLDLVEGASEAVYKLVEHHELFGVTSRDTHFKSLTLDSMGSDLPGAFSDVLFSKSYLSHLDRLFRKDFYESRGYEDKRLYRKLDEDDRLDTKLEICKKLGIELMIEDDMDCVRQFAKSGIPVLLFDRPWNEGELLRPGYKRVGERRNGEKGNHWEGACSYIFDRQKSVMERSQN